MPALNIVLDGDNCWPDLIQKRDQGQLIDLMGDQAPPIGLALLAGGMASGKSSVTIRLDLPDGHTLITETSLALLGHAADVMRSRDELTNSRD
jgi:hypothetical protein